MYQELWVSECVSHSLGYSEAHYLLNHRVMCFDEGSFRGHTLLGQRRWLLGWVKEGFSNPKLDLHL